MSNAYVERGREHERARDAPARAPRQHHIACSHEDLVQVVIEAIRRGSEQARKDGSSVLREDDAIFCAASAACEEALQTYVPLDERRFCEVFTLAWSAGYRAQFSAAADTVRSTTTEASKTLHG